jgi:hypothetical protein
VPRQCPLVLVKVGWKQGKAFGCEVLGVDCWQRGEKLSNWAEFGFGGQHCDGIFIVLPGPCFWAEILDLMLGEFHDKLAVKHEFWLPAEVRKTDGGDRL